MGSFEFKKKFGQNFLTDEHLLAQIVEKSGTMSGEVVVEIGAGKGALTTFLAKSAKTVCAFEIDKTLQDFLTEKFAGSNVNLIFEDVMSWTDEKLNELVGEKFRLVANLPYYITSPIITRFLQNPNLISATVMVQREVADRITAKPKSKDYGVLTIMCNAFGRAQKMLDVGREMFYPVPKVDSAVVRIDKIERKTDYDFGKFIAFVKSAFLMRRKKLSANLENCLILSKGEIEQELKELGFTENVRAEELSLEDFERLYKKTRNKIKLDC